MEHVLWGYEFGAESGFYLWLPPPLLSKSRELRSDSSFELKIVESNCGLAICERFSQIISEFMHSKSRRYTFSSSRDPKFSKFPDFATPIMGGTPKIEPAIDINKQAAYIVIAIVFKGKLSFA